MEQTVIADGALSTDELRVGLDALGRIRISPTAVSQFIRLDQCERYLRLRLHDYDAAGLDAWAGRIEPFLAAGDDVYVFFRHDPVGRAGELALELRSRFPAA